MKTQNKQIRDAMLALIAKSCQAPLTTSQYTGFHKSLLKFYFHATDVTVDYVKNFISISKPTSSSEKENGLFALQHPESQLMEYTNLEETLKECLESSINASRFYKTLLFHYNHVNDPLKTPPLSA
ncbi:MAG: hypothetical protein CMC74_02020 [Flavobacteriaceae bacterium]|nr:hypothetical protein [Flavobacteriaceae bacterium]